MRESKAKAVLLAAVERGYTISRSGIVTGTRGNPLKKRTRNAASHKDWRGHARLLYYVFSVRFEGESHPVDVHRFQAFHKFGNALFLAETVRHLDGDSLNNHWDNLALGTHRDNSLDRPAVQRQLHAQKAADASRMWTDREVRIIRKLYAQGAGLRELSDEYGGSRGQLSDMINRKTYRSVR
jgi:hypothetical protein